MKKLLALVISIILVVSLLSSCTITTPDDKGLDQAYEYVLTMYKDKPVVTPSDYDVIAVVTIDGEAFQVKWEVNVTKGSADSVKVVPNENGKTAKIDVNEKTTTEIEYELKFTVEKNGNSASAGFNHTVPEYKVYSWQQYVDAKEDETLTVRGIVTGIIAKSLGDSYNCLYFEDNDGGYYAYGMTDDPVEGGVKIGDEVYVTGKRTTYSGTWEIKEATFEIVSSGNTVTPRDLTEVYANASSLKDEALASLQSSLVTVKGVEITGQDTGSGYYKFKLGKLESYVRISSSVCPLNADETSAFIEGHTTHFGYIADVTGVVCVYDGAFYITPVDVAAIQYKELPEKSDAEKVALEVDQIKFPNSVSEETTFTLNPTGSTYTDVVIEWSVEGECAKIENGVLTISIPDNDAVVTVKAVVKAGETAEVLEFTINVVATELSYKQIVELAYALGTNEKLDGTYRLFGEVISIDTAYSEQYGNITVTIVVDGMTEKPIQCYRLKGEGAEDIKVGDQITVEGTLKNYTKNENVTIEFDAGCKLLGFEEIPDQSKTLTAAYGLATGEKMTSPSILTGVIKSIDTAYSEQYENITVTIVCPGYDEYPIMCYRLKGEGASLLAVGDKITVFGFIKNYTKNDVVTIEFDAGCVLVPNSKYNQVKTVMAAYKLAGGKSLAEESALEGVIVSIDTEYSTQYENITVTIVVAGLTDYPIQCFRLKGEGAADLKVGDEIYVKGTLKNYVKNEVSTIEFDAGCVLVGVVVPLP
ncbi:MAG: hypothetical protein K6F14_05065 [Clostridiales bacterium]|nr:hypothetical protein [Clostridiales bacterium]